MSFFLSTSLLERGNASFLLSFSEKSTRCAEENEKKTTRAATSVTGRRRYNQKVSRGQRAQVFEKPVMKSSVATLDSFSALSSTTDLLRQASAQNETEHETSSITLFGAF